MRNFFTHLFTVGFLIIAIAISACGPLYEPINITGKVVDSSDRQPISEALVRITAPSNFTAETFSDESGNFLFEEVSIDTLLNITIEVSKEGYNTQSVTVDASPENDISVPNIEISSSEPDQGNDEPDSKGSANITLLSKSASSIQVKSTGGNETATFEFVVRDSTGSPVNSENAATVNFEITAGPDGGEALFPLTATTELGIAKTTLTSGTKSGVVQVSASFVRDGVTEKSEPVPITISGGLPNEDHFEVRSEVLNIPAKSTASNQISVLIGDKYGNTVIPGTAVFFSTNKGNIDGSAETDENGFASSLLRTNGTSPGTANINVESVGEDNNKITRNVEVVFSGEPQIKITPEDVDLLGLTSQDFLVELTDINGNPLAEGTTLNISVDDSSLVVTGATSSELPDTQKRGKGYTQFEFQLRNPERVTITDDVTLTIQTDGPNGSLTKDVVLEVEQPAPAEPGSIFLSSISSESIGVRSTGQREDAQLIFQVMDVNGNPLNNENAIDVDFRFGNRPNDGEFLSPPSVKTDNLGQATVTLTSGTGSGTVQIIAEAHANGRTLRSAPVSVVIHAGHISEEHFSIVVPSRNMNATVWNESYEISVVAGDRYSNFVRDSTAIYFATNGGIIEGSALTVNGRAESELIIANPIPPNGIVTIGASSADHNGIMVLTETQVIFSFEPSISVTPNAINLPNGGDQTFQFSVTDKNGNPMVEGTTISVEAEGTDFELIGDTEITLRDVNSGLSNIQSLTEFSFNIRDADGDNVDDSPIIITIEVDGPNGYAKKVIEGRKAKGL